MKGTLYFRQGFGNNIEYHHVSTLADYLDEHCCRNLPSFHALTGCDFILRTVYNRPANDKTPMDSRLAILFSGKGKSRKFRSTKTLPPNRRSLLMKIKRANLVSYSLENCLNPEILSMDPCDWGWVVRDNLLIPVWFEGSNSPSDIEYDLHIKNTLQNYNEDTDSDISDSESEYDYDEFSASETYSSTDEDDDVGSDNDF